MSRNIYELFFNRTKDAMTSPFLNVPGGLTYTFGQLDRRSAAIATVLTQMGLEPGDRVASQVSKSPDAVALYLGCLRGGFVFVPLDSRLGVEDIGYYLGDCEPKLFVCNESDVSRLRPVADIVGVTEVHTLSSTSTGSLADAANEAHPLVGIAPREANDPAAIIYTAGTTGRSKGAVLTHQNLIANARALHAIWRMRPGDVSLHTLGMASAFGLFVGLHLPLLNASEVIFAEEFSPQTVKQHIRSVSVFMETPDNLGLLLKDQEFSRNHLGDLGNLRLLISSGASLPITVFGDFADRIDLGICECYITSEAGVLASNPPEGERIGGTVGYALPNLDLRIMSPDGNILGPNEIGEIQVKGPMVFSGYWGRQNASESAFTGDQFFHTGDVGFLATDGRLTLAGRVDDMIRSNSKVIYPREIEVVLESLEGVKESVAIGLPHTELGEAVVVFVVSDDRAKRDYLHSALKQNIEAHKLPVDYVFVPDLPKSAVGTVQREQLRRKHAEMFTSKPGYPD